MEIKKQKIAVLNYSAGMDSTGLLLHLLANDYLVKCVSFDYGQRHRIELEKGTEQMNYLKLKGFNIERDIIDISFLGKISNSSLAGKEDIPEGFYEEENMKSTVIENRNAIFASITYAYALSLTKKYDTESVIAQALHAGDHAIYKDCTEDFRIALEHAFKIGNYDSERVSYYTPYMEGNKTSILKEALINCEKLNLDFNIIFKNTNTSYNPDPITGKASGKSGADVERILAFNEIGLVDPCEYVDSWEVVLKNALQVEKEYLNKIIK
jgi:7-cyano-7-deazaguanine synthase